MSASQRLGSRFVLDLAVPGEAGLHEHLVVPVDRQLALHQGGLEEVVQVARVRSQLPPCSAAMSTTTEPGRMRATAAAGMILGAGRPGTEAVVMTASAAAMRASSTSCCL